MKRNFSTSQILREIILIEFRVSKTAILTVLEGLNFNFAQIQPYKIAKNAPIIKIKNLF